MLIVCPSCATSYDVELASLSPSGRQVRCVRCQAVWRAEPSQADKLTLAAAAIGPSPDNDAGAVEETGFRPVTAFESVGTAPFASSAATPDDDSPASDFSERDGLADDGDETEDYEDHEDYSVGTDAPPIAPADLDTARADFADDHDHFSEPLHQAEDIESVAARRQQGRGGNLSLRWPLSLLQTALLTLALIDVILIGWRGDVVRAMPQMASFYSVLRLPVNLRNLTFDDVTTSMEQHEGVPILVVEGNIVNAGRKPEDVPRLKFIVRNAARQEIYSWTAVPSRASLGPGEALEFRTRLASPPATAHDLAVRFVTRRDVTMGGR
jgi:predicted Zn finger-like uncharacterized protein